SALIGHTGFVGGNALKQRTFDDTYNSSNIEEIEGRRYSLVVCAGAPGAKWRANREPDRDLRSIERLMSSLERVSTEHFVLISTVDVYPNPVGVDEDTEIPEGEGSSYGRHRLLLERFVQSHFPSTVMRLPGLFGSGLKKNVIYDLLHDNQLDAISPESVFQFYPLARLMDDTERVLQSGVSLVNFATEPTSVRTIAVEAFGFDFRNENAPPPVRYDTRTKHAAAFGGRGPYLCDSADVLRYLREFVRP
ncbi:MAG TPA: NAD-dependent epimerase/dehydratase family protein, partial [Vicinamibacteria bacterium]